MHTDDTSRPAVRSIGEHTSPQVGDTPKPTDEPQVRRDPPHDRIADAPVLWAEAVYSRDQVVSALRIRSDRLTDMVKDGLRPLRPGKSMFFYGRDVIEFFTRQESPAEASTLESIVSHLAALVEAAERISPQKPKRSRSEKLTHAIAALATIGPNISAIARDVGVPRRTLYHWPEFMDAVSRFDGSARLPRRGRKVRGRGSDVADTIEVCDE